MSVEKHKKVVLTIDDVSMNLVVIKSLLSPYFDVRLAKSGELALSILRNVKVDLILLDIEMPGMSGFDFINVIHKIPYNRAIPIILVTSHANERSIEKALEAGVRDYIVKPVDADILIQKVFAIFNMQIPE